MAPKIAFQGELGAYSHEACAAARPSHQPLPCATFEDVIAAVRGVGIPPIVQMMLHRLRLMHRHVANMGRRIQLDRRVQMLPRTFGSMRNFGDRVRLVERQLINDACLQRHGLRRDLSYEHDKPCQNKADSKCIHDRRRCASGMRLTDCLFGIIRLVAR